MNERRPMRVLVAEDELLAREMLVQMLEELRAKEPELLEVVASVDSGPAALLACPSARPDLLLLDVQMPKLDGFEVLELLEPKIPTIFVTAYDEYAVRAFEAQAVDYLLKPYSAERLERALRRAAERLGAPSAETLDSLRARTRPPGTYLERIAIKDGTEISVLPVPELAWVRSEDDYIRIAGRGREWLKHQSLQSLEESLDPTHFVRIHRTCLVNVARVARVEPETRDRFWVVLDDGTMLPASRQGEKRLRETLGL